MYDAVFKKLKHCYKDYDITYTGQQLMEGYKPDVVLQKDNQYVILESEHGRSRKHFLGGLVKAAKFLTGFNKGFLVIVLQENDNTTVQQIYSHLKPYFSWIQNLTNLQKVYIIADIDYCPNVTPLTIESNQFLAKSLVINDDGY